MTLGISTASSVGAVPTRSYAPTVVDLSQLPPPDVVEALSFDVIVGAMKADFVARWQAARLLDPALPQYDVAMLETDSAVILIQACAFRELLLRARINDAARALLLAYAGGANLDHLGALFGVVRVAIVASPRAYVTNPEDWEGDERLRRRIQLAPEAYSTAGSQGAYIFHAMTVDPSVFDAWAWRPAPGKVEVVLAGADGAAVSDDVVAKLVDFYARADRTPLTDAVSVRKAEVLGYTVSLVLQIPRGPDAATIEAGAALPVKAYAAERYRIRQRAYLVGLSSAAKVGGVENVIVRQPGADVVATDRQIPRLTGLAITSEVL